MSEEDHQHEEAPLLSEANGHGQQQQQQQEQQQQSQQGDGDARKQPDSVGVERPHAKRPKSARLNGVVGLNTAIDVMGAGWYQVGIGLLCGLSEAADGIQQISVSFLIHSFGQLFHLKNHSKALIGSFSGGGMLLGALVWGRISDLRGRKFAFVGTLLMTGIIGLMCALAQNFKSFLVLRFLLCIGIGGNVPLAFTVFTEFSPRLNRGAYLTMLEAFWALGAVASCVIALFVLPTQGWKAYVVWCSIPSIALGIAGIFVLPESPRYLVIHGRIDEAELILDSMAETNGRPQYKGLRLAEASETFESSNVRDLFSPSLRVSTIGLFVMYFSLSFGCGIFIWLPTLLQSKKMAVMSMYRSMIIMALSQIPGVIFASFLVERVGRRPAIAVFFLFGSLTTGLFALAESHRIVVIATILMEFFLAGANGSLSAYTVEVFPTTLRSTGMGACSALSRFSSVINPTIWAALMNISDKTAIFTGASVLMVGFSMLFIMNVETKGRALQDHIKAK